MSMTALAINFRNNAMLMLTLALVACFMRGTLEATDNCDEARKWYDEGVALSDNSEREVSYYKRAVELCPDYFEAHNKLGEVYKSWGNYEQAIEALTKASKSEFFVEPHYHLGEIYRMQGRYDLAVKEFTEAIRMKPDFREAENQLKYVNKRLGKYDAAVAPPGELMPISIFTRIPGMTLPRGTFLIDFQYRYLSQEAAINEKLFVGEAPPLLSRASRRESNVYAQIFGIRYGLTDDFTIGLLPMYFTREAEVDFPFAGVYTEPSVSGFGDTVLLTKYHIWGKRRFHLSAYHLLGIPTGDEEAEGNDQGIKRKIPLGSGGFDSTPGLTFSAMAEPFTIHSNVSYVFTEGRQAGDELHWNLAIALPRFRGVTPILELNYRWRDDDRRTQYYQTKITRPPVIGPPWNPQPGGTVSHEVTIEERGGHTLLFSPGLQLFVAKRVKVEIGMQIPIIKPSDDLAWAEEIVLHVGVMKYFF